MIGAAARQQLAGDFGVPGGAGELVDDFAVPVEAEPGQPVDDRGDRLRRRALPVGVLDAQAEDAAFAVQLVMAGEQPVEQRRAGAADMQKAGRGRGKTDDDALVLMGRYVGAARRLRHRLKGSADARIPYDQGIF